MDLLVLSTCFRNPELAETVEFLVDSGAIYSDVGMKDAGAHRA